ncbi:DUF29 domain-containing protein [Moorena sp. SIO3H5]|uniref:DUF29 domain-containing protein n=1 Tax=Moorena sp. SIO3H5 TaxID=2607834 RepID=UPI0013B8EC24|nr:DUF29 domain-containing protein [Moorena sp. SIO3H5]NEO69930.1 DUF29 domain-containing protein [Moorena sp. SIO3H5]
MKPYTSYDTDYYQWINETVENLRNRNFSEVDWENLIEEIESMGKSEKRALLSLLNRLLEHLLKLAYWKSEQEKNRNHWAAEVVNFRAQIKTIIEDSPSLRPQLENFYNKAYPSAVKSVSKLFVLPPEADIYLTQALDDDWFP